MALTQREKTLVIVVPATLVFIIYGFAVNRSKQADMTALRHNLDAARNSAPTRQKLVERQVHLLKMQAETKNLESRTRTEQQRWEALAGQCADAKKRNQRHEKLTTLLAQHHLSLLEDGPHDTDKSSHEMKPSAPLETVAKQLAKGSANQQPQLWRLRLYGRYLDMLGALEQLGEGEVLAIPVGLNMKEPTPGGKGREWVLLMWI